MKRWIQGKGSSTAEWRSTKKVAAAGDTGTPSALKLVLNCEGPPASDLSKKALAIENFVPTIGPAYVNGL